METTDGASHMSGQNDAFPIGLRGRRRSCLSVPRDVSTAEIEYIKKWCDMALVPEEALPKQDAQAGTPAFEATPAHASSASEERTFLRVATKNERSG